MNTSRIRKTLEYVIVAALAVILSISQLGCSRGGGQGTGEENGLRYLPSNRYWINNGTKLVVEGSIFSFLDEYDVLKLKNAVIYLVDTDDNVVATINVNEDAIGVIPHNGYYPYNFTVTDIEGGSSAYNAKELVPELETDYLFEEHQLENCPHCGESGPGEPDEPDDPNDPDPQPQGEKQCSTCGGSGKCHVCNGKRGAVCPGLSCNRGRCTACDGHGHYNNGRHTSRCIVCSGDGFCDICDGTGIRPCGTCNGTGECQRCGGDGAL